MNYEKAIKKILMEIGANPALNGFTYLVDAISMSIEDKKNKKTRPMMHLYTEVGARHNATGKAVVRALDYCIEKIFDKDNKSLKKLFDAWMERCKKPVSASNKEFSNSIYQIVEDFEKIIPSVFPFKRWCSMPFFFSNFS